MVTVKDVRQIVLHREGTPTEMWVRDTPETRGKVKDLMQNGWVLDLDSQRKGNINLFTRGNVRKYKITLPSQPLEVNFLGWKSFQPTTIEGAFNCTFDKINAQKTVICRASEGRGCPTANRYAFLDLGRILKDVQNENSRRIPPGADWSNGAWALDNDLYVTPGDDDDYALVRAIEGKERKDVFLMGETKCFDAMLGAIEREQAKVWNPTTGRYE